MNIRSKHENKEEEFEEEEEIEDHDYNKSASWPNSKAVWVDTPISHSDDRQKRSHHIYLVIASMLVWGIHLVMMRRMEHNHVMLAVNST